MIARVFAAAMAALLLPVAPATASCIPLTRAQQLERADAVFTGRVLSVSASGATAWFRVKRVRKGPLTVGSRVRVKAWPYPSSTTTGWRPRPRQRWKVYANRRDGRWWTDDCNGTRRN